VNIQSQPCRTQIWSATPTPFTEGREIDIDSVFHMVEHHVRLGVQGLFLAGTCGEGPWMTDGQKSRLVSAVREAAAGRLRIAVQVTDNSAERVLDQIAALDGADLAVVAQPYLAMNATPKRMRAFYEVILTSSPLPVCYYERGRASAVEITEDVLQPILAHPNLVMVKDSSADPRRRDALLKAREARSNLALLLGDEFRCVDYLLAGYDGVMLGGAILNALYVAEIVDRLSAGDVGGARTVESRMIAMLHGVYGGPDFPCWLNGLKSTLVRLGIFRTSNAFLDYPLSPDCSQMISRLIESERSYLLPS
jgi:4-hydroxy-tetrahydrodipicolinate synthase